MPDFEADPLLGQVIEGLQIQSILGKGNMGLIYRAVPVDGGPAVAFKVLQRFLARDTELVERFQREFAYGSKVRHPNVVDLIRIGATADGVHFQVQELLDGVPLDTVIASAPLPLARIVNLGSQIAAGLGAAHAVGVVHRDLKPENVMVLADDRVKLFDFGLARAKGQNLPTLTAGDMRLGTPMFMAPEYIATGELDHRADLYALGIALFELASGTEPFEGPPFKILHLHVTADPPRLSERNPDVHPGLDALVDALLKKDPDDRPQTAAEVGSALRGLLV